MEFSNIEQAFTDKEKLDSFLYLQEYILDKNSKNEKFFIGRLTGTESIITSLLLNNPHIPNIPNYLIYNMLIGAGIKFNSRDDIKKYASDNYKSCVNSDILAIWDGVVYNSGKNLLELLEKTNKTKPYIAAHGLEPFYFMENEKYKFNEIFKNKKVLIISSHINTINKQIENGNYKSVFSKKIFDDSTIIKVYKPPQQNVGLNDDNNWLFHFDKIKSDLTSIQKEFDFDIAIVSCGGFGMLTSNFINETLNKSVIYVGGALQLFFGIMGNRWKKNPIISKMQNNYWTDVLEEDKPHTLKQNPRLCEGGCYW